MLQKANLNLAITGCLPIKQAIMTATVFDNSLKFQNFEGTPGDWNLCKKTLLTLQDLFYIRIKPEYFKILFIKISFSLY